MLLVKTVKGYGMGNAGEAKNPTHQLKKLDKDAIREFRDRFNIPVKDEELEKLPFFKPADDSPEMQYMLARRKPWAASCRNGGPRPTRRSQCRRSRSSSRCSKPPPKAARSRPRRPSSGC